MKLSRTFSTATFSAVTLLAAGSALPVHAADAPPTPKPAGAGPHMDGPQAMHERRARELAEVHDLLKITPAQENAWTQYASVMATPPGEAAKLPRPTSLERPTAVELAERDEAMTTSLANTAHERTTAIKALYAQLSPDQQKLFDFVAAKRPRHHGGPAGHMPPPPAR